MGVGAWHGRVSETSTHPHPGQAPANPEGCCPRSWQVSSGLVLGLGSSLRGPGKVVPRARMGRFVPLSGISPEENPVGTCSAVQPVMSDEGLKYGLEGTRRGERRRGWPLGLQRILPSYSPR